MTSRDNAREELYRRAKMFLFFYIKDFTEEYEKDNKLLFYVDKNNDIKIISKDGNISNGKKRIGNKLVIICNSILNLFDTDDDGDEIYMIEDYACSNQLDYKENLLKSLDSINPKLINHFDTNCMSPLRSGIVGCPDTLTDETKKCIEYLDKNLEYKDIDIYVGFTGYPHFPSELGLPLLCKTKDMLGRNIYIINGIFVFQRYMVENDNYLVRNEIKGGGYERLTAKIIDNVIEPIISGKIQIDYLDFNNKIKKRHSYFFQNNKFYLVALSFAYILYKVYTYY